MGIDDLKVTDAGQTVTIRNLKTGIQSNSMKITTVEGDTKKQLETFEAAAAERTKHINELTDSWKETQKEIEDLKDIVDTSPTTPVTPAPTTAPTSAPAPGAPFDNNNNENNNNENNNNENDNNNNDNENDNNNENNNNNE